MLRPIGSVTGLAAFWNRNIIAARCGRSYSKPELRMDICHTMRQNVNDYRRRGQSNREGGNNRRWRKYQTEKGIQDNA